MHTRACAPTCITSTARLDLSGRQHARRKKQHDSTDPLRPLSSLASPRECCTHGPPTPTHTPAGPRKHPATPNQPTPPQPQNRCGRGAGKRPVPLVAALGRFPTPPRPARLTPPSSTLLPPSHPPRRTEAIDDASIPPSIPSPHRSSCNLPPPAAHAPPHRPTLAGTHLASLLMIEPTHSTAVAWGDLNRDAHLHRRRCPPHHAHASCSLPTPSICCRWTAHC